MTFGGRHAEILSLYQPHFRRSGSGARMRSFVAWLFSNYVGLPAAVLPDGSSAGLEGPSPFL